VGRTFRRGCGREVIRETAEVVATRLVALPAGTRLLVGFDMPVVTAAPMDVAAEQEPDEDDVVDPAEADAPAPQPELPDLVDSVAETIAALRRKGFGRLYIDGAAVALEDVDTASLKDRTTMLQVIVDRVKIDADAGPLDRLDRDRTRRGAARRSRSKRLGDRVLLSGSRPRVHLQHLCRSASFSFTTRSAVPALSWLRQHHRARHGSGRARRLEVDPAERHRAVVPHHARSSSS
jgi:hypothetical protein